jgi:hypothetical protein
VPRLLARPPIALGLLVLVQWTALLAFAHLVRHNGWLFYQGGDQTFFYTASWAISGGHIPESQIGYGWSYLISPIARAVGPNFVAALPPLLLVQTVVLWPLALYCVYAITANIGGRVLGYFAAAAWVGVPFAAIPLWDDSYHEKYVDQFLPQAFGLTGMGDFPSMVCLLAAALFCLRALDTGARLDALLAGLTAGFAIGIKPANALFLAGPLVAFSVARRFRTAYDFGLALLLPVLALALWKYRGLGHLPILTPNPEAVAAEGRLMGGDSLTSGLVLDRYLDLDWAQLGKNYVDFRESFWGVPLLQALPLLGLVVATRRSWPKALLLGGWLGAFVFVKGSSPQVNVDSGTFLHLLLPGFPPLLILAALVPLLIPWLGRRPRLRFARWTARTQRVGILAFAVFAFVPLLLFAAVPTLGPNQAVYYYPESVQVPVDEGFSVEVRRVDRSAEVSWRAPPSPGVHVFYSVFRSRPVVPTSDPTLPPGRDGIRCQQPDSPGYAGAADCALEMSLVGVTRSNRFLDRPPPGAWVYRVGLAANWRDDANPGNVLLLSKHSRLSAPS